MEKVGGNAVNTDEKAATGSSRSLRLIKNKTAEDAKNAEVLAVSASLFYTERDKRRRNDEKTF